MKVLFLSTGAFGFTGGIAEFERAFLSALCSMPEVEEVLAFPRNKTQETGSLPKKLEYRWHLAGSLLKYLVACAGIFLSPHKPSLVICGHIHLLPFAYLASGLGRVPIVLMTYGIEAWQPGRMLCTWFLSKVHAQISISEYTVRRMREWTKTGPEHEKTFILPVGIDTERFTPGTKRDDLLEKHDLREKKILLTVARLAPEERYKGIDEVLDVLPAMIEKTPSLTYLIAGKGKDRRRLEEKVVSLGLQNNVVFTGYISEDDKPDYYRLADVFVMPSSGEGFGIVFLEAMACATPVIAGNNDGAQEALRGGSLGTLVDPKDAGALRAAIESALEQERRFVPEGLEYFSKKRFEQRVGKIVRSLL